MTQRELKKILLAEDEPDIRMIAQIALEDIGGFTVKFCESGLQAVNALSEFNPDMILLDMMMPEMDGLTALVEIRKNLKFSNVPIIFLTAKAQSSEIDDYRKIGAADVITKPFDPMTLADKLNAIWMQVNGG